MSTIAIKERPILFSGEMVRAILDERKTQTRRVVKPQPNTRVWKDKTPSGELHWFTNRSHSFGSQTLLRCPFGVPGDRLWVRETWQRGVAKYDGESVSVARFKSFATVMGEWDLVHEQDCEVQDAKWEGRWRPSIHMPRWASRITLEVADVRVERLQEIEYEDIQAEGFEVPMRKLHVDPFGIQKQDFASGWDALHAKTVHTWDKNPWVWVVEFKQVEA